MKWLFCLALICSAISCKPKEKLGIVGFEVWEYAPPAGSKAFRATVSVYKDGKLFSERNTDDSYRVSFLLEPGDYTAIAREGFDLGYTSDRNDTYNPDSTDANGPHEFSISAGESKNFMVIMAEAAAGLGTEGNIRVVVRKLTANGEPCANAVVKMQATYTDALNGTPFLVRQNTSSDGAGSTTFTWEPGEYYLVAQWHDSLGMVYTSDSTHVKNYIAGPPPNSEASGPQLVTIKKDLTTNVTLIVDERE